MRLRGVPELGRAAHWLRSRFVSGGIILMYHRIAETDDDASEDPFALSVSLRHFAEHLEVLRRMGTPIGLRDLVGALRAGGVPSRAVALTFDDGYADNLYLARPLLARHPIPATVFVATGYLDGERDFWWDELARMLCCPGALPRRLRLEVRGDIHEWAIRDGRPDTEGRMRRGRPSGGAGSGPGQRILRAVYKLLRPLPQAEQRSVLDQLRAQVEDRLQGRPAHRPLSSGEVVELARDGLIEIGAHTVTHPVLATLPVSAQRAEIRQSQDMLQGLLGQPVTSFSYPYGLASDYSTDSVAAVRDAGFACACSAIVDVTWRGSDRLQLPRLWVRDWDGQTFARRLGRWLGGRMVSPAAGRVKESAGQPRGPTR